MNPPLRADETHLAGLGRALMFSFGMAFLLGLPIAVTPFGAHPFSYAKFGWAVACAACIFMGVLLQASQLNHIQLRLTALLRDPVLAAFAVNAIWLSLTSATAISRSSAFLGDSLRREGMVALAATSLLAAAVFFTVSSRRHFLAWVACVALAAVMPALAAWGQFASSDRTFTVTIIGTAGNPVFLGAVMMLALPLLLAMLLNASSTIERTIASALVAVVFGALLLTFARGPLVGTIIAAWMLIVWIGVSERSKALARSAFCIPALAVVALLAINLIPGLSDGTPALSRFLIRASSSSDARLGIWAAGTAAFADAGLFRQMVGHGVDTGVLVYMSHLPAWVFRLEGMGLNIDRMHSLSFETLMTSGVVGVVGEAWLFGMVIWRGLGAMGLHLKAGPAFGVAALFALVGGFVGVQLVSAAALIPMAGVGYGLGWLTVWLWASRKAADAHSRLSSEMRQDRRWLAALCAGLVGYWVEAQLGVNDISVRALAVCMAALLVAYPRISSLADETESLGNGRSTTLAESSAPSLVWLVAPLVPLAFLAGAPPVLAGSAWAPPAIGSMLWVVAQLLAISGCLLLTVRVVGQIDSTKVSGQISSGAWKILVVLMVGLFLYAVLHYVLMSTLAEYSVHSLVILSGMSNVYWVVCGIALGVTLVVALASFARTPHAPLADFAQFPNRAIAATALGLVAAAAAGMFVTSDLRSDMAARMHNWAKDQGNGPAMLMFAREAALASPTSRISWVALAQAEFSHALVASSLESADREQRVNALRQHLEQSSVAAQRGLSLDPTEPLLLGLMAEINSLKAAPYAADAFGGGAARKGHGQEAIRYFEQSLKTRGNHPYSLRSLVRLELDYGTRERALQFAERLIASDPKSEIGYEEKALIALKANDMAQFAAVLRDGIEKTGGAVSLRRPLAEWLFRQGDVAGATRELEAVVSKTPKDWTAVRDLIRLYLRQNANDKALALGQSARAFVPDQERASLEELLRNLAPQPFTGGGLKP